MTTLAKQIAPTHVVRRWFTMSTKDVGKHGLMLLVELGGRASLLDEIRQMVKSHYVAPEVTAKRMADLGAPQTAALLKEHLPLTKTARSGDLGEILATEVAELHLAYGVPVRRLRWKDGRNMALRGDDIIGLSRDSKGRLQFLKAESKSRATLSSAVIDEAATSLERDRGRPTRHSVLFVAERLREMSQHDVAKELEVAVLDSFRGYRVEHLLFTLTGGDPENLLSEHLKACATKLRRRNAIGVRIDDHATFIADLFSGI